MPFLVNPEAYVFVIPPDRDRGFKWCTEQIDDPESWVILWKMYRISKGSWAVRSPYYGVRLDLTSQKVVPHKRVRDIVKRRGDRQIVEGGAIHAYYSKPRQLFHSWITVRCFSKVKDIVAVGSGGDVATKRLIIDQDDLNLLRERVGLDPIQWG